jgi:photosystem II stability/assembly factor-like uncharacterized protein
MKIGNILYLLVVLSLITCNKENDDLDPNGNGNEPLEPVIAPVARVMDNTARGSLLSIDTSDFTLVFRADNTFAEGLAINDIIVDGVNEIDPHGMLRKVVSVQNDGENITVKTVQARLTEVIQQGSISLDSVALKSSDITGIKLAKGVSMNNNLKNTDLLGFDIDFDYPVGNNQETKIKGSLYFELDFNFDLDIGLTTGVTYFKTSVEVEEMASLGLDLQSAVTINEQIKFAEITFSPWTVWVGIIPVVFVPKVEFLLKSDLTVTAALKTFATQSYNRELGLEFDKSRDEQWKLINSSDPKPDYTLQPPALEGNASFTVKAGPQAELLLYGIAGPYINLFLSSSIDAQVSPNGYTMDYNLDLESNAGVKVDVLVYELEKNYQLFSINLVNQKLNDEPLTQTFTLENPISGQKIVIGEKLKIQTYTTGIKPSEVVFYADNTVIGSDNSYPFEYSWTADGNAGDHILKAVASYGAASKESEVTIKLVAGGWEYLDLSYLFTDNFFLESVTFFDTDKGWIMGRTYSAGLPEVFGLRTEDGGRSWSKIFTRDYWLGNPPEDIVLMGEQDGFYTQGGWLFQTTDGGNNWGFVNGNSYFIEVNQAGDMFAADYYEINVLRSGGSGNWELFSTVDENDPDPMEIDGISFPVDNTGFLIGEKYNEISEAYDPMAVKITNNGATWTNLNARVDNVSDTYIYTRIFFVDNSNGFIIGRTDDYNEGFILKTTDGGQSWTTTVTEKYPLDIFFLDKETGYITYYNFPNVKIGYTTDGGQTWDDYKLTCTQEAFVNEDHMKIFFIDKAHGWYVFGNVFLRYGLVE